MKLRFIPVAGDDQETVERLSRLASQIVKEHYDPIIGPEQNDYMIEQYQSASSLAAQIGRGCRYYRTEAGSEDAGFFAIEPREGGVLFLSKFYLRKEFRRKGIGRKQLEFIEARARELGRHTVRLTVNRKNLGSIEAYRHLGFHVAGEQATDIGHGFVMDDYVMEKEV